MRWSDTITLIKQTPKGSTGTGFEPEYDETPRAIYCNISGTWSSDFYTALQAGIVISMRATVRTPDYQGERLAEVKDKRYTITRSEISNNGEFTTLTLADEKNRVSTNVSVNGA